MSYKTTFNIQDPAQKPEAGTDCGSPSQAAPPLREEIDFKGGRGTGRTSSQVMRANFKGSCASNQMN